MSEPLFRTATAADLPAIVRLLADDDLGRTRERVADPLPQPYLDAFVRCEAQAGNRHIVGEVDGEVIACLQLLILPGLARLGALRAQLEGIRVSSAHRGQGIGTRLLRFAIEEARREGCRLVQLTSDVQRPEAHRLYERLGFHATHVGMKLRLADSGSD
jgi:ribosomal protein S18 acetylase RimI-like enzyme